MRIDPHTHSACFDGTDSPAELTAEAAGAGLDVVGLTDHDTMSGWQGAARAVPDIDVALLRGIEISCAADGVTPHLLPYLHWADDAGLEVALARARRPCDSRAQRMVGCLNEDYPVTWENALTQSADSHTISRPHIVDALVAAGSFPDRNVAFARPLATSSPYYIHHWALDLVEACRLVRAAGGAPVAAHPRAASYQRRLVPGETFVQTVEAGPTALEMNHRDQDPEQREQVRLLVQRLGLGLSGASDYHGTGKPNRLGENLMPPELLEKILDEGALDLVRP